MPGQPGREYRQKKMNQLETLKTPYVSIIIVTWNATEDIEETLDSLEEQTYKNSEIILVDSASSDNTVELVRSKYPSVHIIESADNIGYRRGNRLGMNNANGEHIVICNDDVRLDPNCIGELVKTLEDNPTTGLATPVIMNYYEPDLISAAGNTLHYTGMTGHSLARDSGREYAFEIDSDLSAVSGCCFIIRREAMVELGGFSNDFDALDTGWHAASEDADLSLRARMRGYGITLVPSALMYHKHDGKRPVTPNLFASAEWARYLLVFRNYETRTLILMIPAFMMLELMSIVFSAMKGREWLRSKLLVYRWIFKNFSTLRKMRSEVQDRRTVPDSTVLPKLDPTINRARLVGLGPFGKLIEKTSNAVFLLYHRFLCFAVSL